MITTAPMALEKPIPSNLFGEDGLMQQKVADCKMASSSTMDYSSVSMEETNENEPEPEVEHRKRGLIENLDNF